jgi:hypothetical protein
MAIWKCEQKTIAEITERNRYFDLNYFEVYFLRLPGVPGCANHGVE